MKFSNCSLFLFTVLILINLSSCKLNLFRPFASGRLVKSAAADSDLEPDKLPKLQPAKEQQPAVEQPTGDRPNEPSNEEQSNSLQLDDEQLSLGQFLSRKISQAINEIEMKLEDQLMNNNVNESQFEHSDGLLSELAPTERPVAEHHEPVRPASVGSEIGSAAGEIDGNQLAVKTEAASSSDSRNNESSSTESKVTGTTYDDRPAESTFDEANNSTSTALSVASVDRALGVATNELSVGELTRLRSAFRTFGSILDFLVNVFDEFAEAIVSRSATLLINSFFDRTSMFLLGI